MPCPSETETYNYGGEVEAAKRWHNYIGAVDITVANYWKPKTLQDLVYIVKRAHDEGRNVHAVGAGYSFEDLAASTDWMVDLRHLGKLLLVNGKVSLGRLTVGWAKRQNEDPRDDKRRLIHAQAGIRLFDLCRSLPPGLALPTMGGALGQHLAGAISTSTHGRDVNQ